MNNQIDYALDLIRTQLVSHEIARGSSSDSFELLILASTHDLPLAFFNIEHMRKLYGPRLIKSTVVAQEYPENDVPAGIEIVTDSELLQNPKIIKCLDKFGSRASWMRQQYLKSYMVHAAKTPVLILDADTFLIRALSWHSSSKQLLLINTTDYHTPYSIHASKFLGLAMPALNFVSHAQLQIPSIINEIYSSDFDSGWIKWAESSRKFGEDSPASEFQTYGGFVVSKYRNQLGLYIPNHRILDGEQMTLNVLIAELETLHADLVTIGNKNHMQL
jgi:hypothetical protein